jgi:hypothetical protein
MYFDPRQYKRYIEDISGIAGHHPSLNHRWKRINFLQAFFFLKRETQGVLLSQGQVWNYFCRVVSPCSTIKALKGHCSCDSNMSSSGDLSNIHMILVL